MRLWEWRAGEVANGRGDPAELRGFGWLVRTGRFPADWMLAYLAQVTSALAMIEMPEQVAETIAPYAQSYTRLVLAVFRGLVRNREDGWVAHVLSKHAAPAIAVALHGSDEELQQEARALMSAFAEAGISDIRALVAQVHLAE